MLTVEQGSEEKHWTIFTGFAALSTWYYGTCNGTCYGITMESLWYLVWYPIPVLPPNGASWNWSNVRANFRIWGLEYSTIVGQHLRETVKILELTYCFSCLAIGVFVCDHATQG
jgi:hypothetical protein